MNERTMQAKPNKLTAPLSSRFRGRIRLPLVLKCSAWLSVAIASCVIGLGVFFLVASEAQWSQALPLASLLIAVASILLTFAGHLFTQSRDVSEAGDKRSNFYLQATIGAYEKAIDLLSDKNNERASGLLQTVCRLFSVSWARMTFARMS
jgi:hypothetical protein